MDSHRSSGTTNPKRGENQVLRSGATLLLAALLAAGLAGCATGSATLPANLPSVSGGLLSVVTSELADGIEGRAYTNQVETTGAFIPITACNIVQGDLPAGLNASPSGDTCAITGMPTQTGTFNFTLQVRDSALIPQNVSVDLTLTIRPEFTITAFQVVDAVAGRDYNNSFTVTTNLQNNPVSSEIGSGEPGNGPAVSCQVGGLPANMTATCTPNINGTMDVTLQNTGALTASGLLNLTFSVTDTDIQQLDSHSNPFTVVAGTAVDNTSTAAPFALDFAVRDAFSITSALPVLPDGAENAPYDETISITTNLAVNANDSGQAAEFGNGPITSCTVQGLPTGLSSSFVLTGGGTGCDITIDSGNITDVQGVYPLTIVVEDTDIVQNAQNVVLLASSTQAPDLTVQGILRMNVSTVDPGATTACTGGTFTDATPAAPDAVNGRTYGGPARCDLLFTATGGVAPMTWNVSAKPAYLTCTAEGTGNRLLRCNSGGATASGALANVTVDVTDNTATNVNTDDNGHASHTINVLSALGLNANAAGATPPIAVQGRTYGNTADSTCTGGACQALTYTAANGLVPYVFSVPPTVAAPAVDGVPDAVACTAGATTATCTSGTTALTAATGSYPFAVQVDDTANDTTPSSSQTFNGSITVNGALAITLTQDVNVNPASLLDGVDTRTYGVINSNAGAPVYTAAGGAGTGSYTYCVSAGALPGGFSGISASCAAPTVADSALLTASPAAGAGSFNFTVQLSDIGNASTPASNSTSDTIPVAIDILPELEFALFTSDNASGPFTATDPPPPGVEGRAYAGLGSGCGPAGTDSCQAVVFLPTLGTGLGTFAWDTPVAGLPGDLECDIYNSSRVGAPANDEMACYAEAVSGGAVVPQPTAGTFNFAVTLRDAGNAAVPAGAQSTDNNAHASHDIIINNPLALAISVGDATNLPGAVDTRAYADTALSTCGATGSTACQALTYTATGGLGDATVDGSYVFSENATGLLVPGAGLPDAIGCTTGTNPDADKHTCVATAASPVDVTTTGTYTPAVTLDDQGNATTRRGSSSGPVTTATEQRNLVVNDALGLSVSPDPPEIAVNGRSYGNSGIATCSGGVCVPVLYTASGGLGDATVDGSYTFSENATGLTAPGAGFPDGILCATGTNPDADKHVCSATVAVAVNTTGAFTPEVTVVDTGNETTPIGAGVPLSRALTVNPELEYSLATSPTGIVGSFTPSDPFPQGVAGRTYADLLAAAPHNEAIAFLATQGRGLGGFSWDPIVTALPGSVTCGVFSSGAGEPNDQTGCFQSAGAPALAGLYPISATLHDTANLSTPAGAQSVDNLGHSSHVITINPALSITSPSPLDSAIDGSAYANLLMGTGGLAASYAWTETAGAGFANDPGGDCGTLALSGAGAISGTPAIVTDNSCDFSSDLNDGGNATTPDSVSVAGTASAALSIPIAATGSEQIANDVLVNGLEGYAYNQTFDDTGPGSFTSWFAGSVGAPSFCPTGSGTAPTGTSISGNALTGTATTAGTYSFSVCGEEAGGTYSLKNFTVVINPPTVYVTNSGAGTVTPIDFSSDLAGANIAVGTSPRAVAFSPDGTRAYVTNETANSVSMINTLTNAVVATVDIGAGSKGIAVTPDGTKAYFTKFGGDSVGILDLTSDPPTLSGTSISLDASGDAQPRGIAISPDGNNAYVANSGTDTLSVLDLTSDTELTTIAAGTGPHGVAVDPDGLRVYVTGPSPHRVRVFDISTPATPTLTAIIDLGAGTLPEGITLTPDARSAYVAQSGNDGIRVINTENNTDDASTPPQPPLVNTIVTGIPSSGTAPNGIAAIWDSTKVYAANAGGNNVSVIDSNSTSGTYNTVTATVGVDSTPQSEMGVAAMPYPVLHFTRAVDGVASRRILAQGDDDQPANPDYSDFIRVEGGVGPYTWAEVGGSALSDNTACAGLSLNVNTGEVSGNPNPGGGNGVKDCDFSVTVTDSATVPQVIQGDFRLVITED